MMSTRFLNFSRQLTFAVLFFLTSFQGFSKPHLMLCFDVNNTLIIEDIASGKSLEQSLQSSLTEQAWGRVKSDGSWELVSEEPSLLPPESGLVSYSDYLYHKFSLLEKVSKEEDSSQTKAANKLHNKAIQKQRTDLKRSFVEEGQPGSSLRQYYEETFLNKMTLPVEVSQKTGRKHFYIVPAFFHLINYLEKNNRSYSIIFRTFGVDVEEVTQEFFQFLKGEHPVFPRLYGKSSQKEDPTLSIGCIFRGELMTSLNLGTLLKHNSDDSFPFQNMPERSMVGDKLIYKYMIEQSKKGVHLSFQDHFQFWISHGKSSDSGKPHYVDTTDTSIHPIFFDDNIKLDKSFIVSVKDLSTAKQLSHKESLNKWIYKVEPLKAIEDPLYYIKALGLCEENFKANSL